MKHRYYVAWTGDEDVGIHGTFAEVVFDDNISHIHEENEIEFVKKMLSELYDVPPSSVMTEEENKQMEEIQ